MKRHIEWVKQPHAIIFYGLKELSVVSCLYSHNYAVASGAIILSRPPSFHLTEVKV